MKLVYDANQQEVKEGDEVTLRDGQKHTIDSIELPRHSGSTGRVHLINAKGHKSSYFPSVIDATWIEREDQKL